MPGEVSVFETIFGVPYQADRQECYRRLFECITGEPWTLEKSNAEEQRIQQIVTANQYRDDESLCVTDVERALSHEVLAQLMQDDAQWVNNFFDWPLYKGIFEARGHPTNGGNALLLGANESLSSIAFLAMAKEIYNVDKAYIVDLFAGSDKQKHGNFIFGDVLRLPFRGESMDIVHSNHLVHMIVDQNDEYATVTERMRRVLAEACRVLRHGGQICMREVLVNARASPDVHSTWHYQSLSRSVRTFFESEGFSEVFLVPVVAPKSLEGLVDPDRKFWQFGYEVREHSYMIYAAKA